MTKDYAFHPAANIYPLMHGEAYERFKADIAKRGVKVPIVLYQGKIVDGRNRFRAAKELGKEIPTEPWDEEGTLLDFIDSSNLHRRHLDTSGLAMVAAKRMEYETAEAKKRQKAGLKQGSKTPVPVNLPERVDAGDARDKAGAHYKVSGKSVDSAVKVLESENKELIKAVERGNIAVSRAAEVTALPKARQTEIAKLVNTNKKAGTEAIKEAIGSPRRAPNSKGKSRTVRKTQIEALQKCMAEVKALTEKPDMEVSFHHVRLKLRDLMTIIDKIAKPFFDKESNDVSTNGN